jgi:transposase-like protein
MQTAQQPPIEHFCCQNKACPDAGQRGQGNLYFRGFSGRGQRIRMVYCRTCKKSCSERKGTPLQDSRLPPDKALSLLEHVREGCGTRATSRLVKVDKNTVTRYVRLAGPHAEKLHREKVAFSPSDPRSPTR